MPGHPVTPVPAVAAPAPGATDATETPEAQPAPPQWRVIGLSFTTNAIVTPVGPETTTTAPSSPQIPNR